MSSDPRSRRVDPASDRDVDVPATSDRDVRPAGREVRTASERDAGASPSPGIRPTRRRTIARYDDYAGAQRAVDYLSDERFPVEHVAIVGIGLRYEEQVTGRRDFPRAILEATLTGLVLGALLGWFFGLFSLVDPLVSGLVLALWGALIGALLGAAFGAAAHAATGGRRDFSSVRGYRADEYEVQVVETRADEAERLLERMPGRL